MTTFFGSDDVRCDEDLLVEPEGLYTFSAM